MGVILKNPIGYKMLCRVVIGICDVLRDPDRHYEIKCMETLEKREEVYSIITFSDLYDKILYEVKINRSRLNEVLHLLEKENLLYIIPRNSIKEFLPFRNHQCIIVHIPPKEFEIIKESNKWRPKRGKITRIDDVTIDDLVRITPSRTKFIIIPKNENELDLGRKSIIKKGILLLQQLEKCCKSIQQILLCKDTLQVTA